MTTHDTWTYTRNPEKTRWIIDSAPGHAVACTAGYSCDDENVARLIAAAPELLAALEALHSCHRAFSSNENWTAMDDDVRAVVESAIAKATGQ